LNSHCHSYFNYCLLSLKSTPPASLGCIPSFFLKFFICPLVLPYPKVHRQLWQIVFSLFPHASPHSLQLPFLLQCQSTATALTHHCHQLHKLLFCPSLLIVMLSWLHTPTCLQRKPHCCGTGPASPLRDMDPIDDGEMVQQSVSNWTEAKVWANMRDQYRMKGSFHGRIYKTKICWNKGGVPLFLSVVRLVFWVYSPSLSLPDYRLFVTGPRCFTRIRFVCKGVPLKQRDLFIHKALYGW